MENKQKIIIAQFNTATFLSQMMSKIFFLVSYAFNSQNMTLNPTLTLCLEAC